MYLRFVFPINKGGGLLHPFQLYAQMDFQNWLNSCTKKGWEEMKVEKLSFSHAFLICTIKGGMYICFSLLKIWFVGFYWYFFAFP